jgi:16S rRNA processing protein RimM
MDKLVVGEIIKAHGVKGGVKVKPFTDDIMRFKRLKTVYIEGEDTKRAVIGCTAGGGFAILLLEGIASRTDAETLNGKRLFIERENAVKLKKGQYFISDLIGCKMYDEGGRFLGEVAEMLSHGAADIFVVKGPRNFMAPFVEGLVAETDTDGKTITVNGKRLSEVACYED